MCRFLLYTGQEVTLSDLIIKPKHSLINQSTHSKERTEPLNGDGFGVGWYAPHLSREPCIFTSVSPAWSNRNLHRLADVIVSPLIFAHVRAASSGLAVSDLNCHPFRYKRFMWMHNGVIQGFEQVKRTLREKLSDELYNMVQGTTDSELAFALFLQQLPKDLPGSGIAPLKEAMLKTIQLLNQTTQAAGIKAASHYNFAVTNGKAIVASRYTSCEDDQPESLYYLIGERFSCVGGVCHVTGSAQNPKAIVVASEKLTADKWQPVPKNHVLTIDSSLALSVEPIENKSTE